ncbi:STN domain-containing protein [Bacteroides fragilis]|nr:STN domain-containing protein [Bacteroides fragilis]
MKLTKKVSVDVTDAPIENVLDQIFNNSGYTYKIIDNQIVVSAIKAEIPKTSSLQQQKKCAYHRTSKRYHRRTYHWCSLGGKRVSK